MRLVRVIGVVVLLACLLDAQQQPSPGASAGESQVDPKLLSLSEDFWAWRAQEMPFSLDDIPRLERPAGWVADWSAQSVAKSRSELARFESRWKALRPPSGFTNRRDEVDYRLIGSALARVRWELDLVGGWKKNPYFYVDQSLDAIHTLLLQPPPFDESRSREIVGRIKNIPKLLKQGEQNLTESVAPFAQVTIGALKDIRPQLETVSRELRLLLAADAAAELEPAMQKAITALEQYREWLKQKLPGMSQKTAVGRENFEFFLRNVALVPYTPDELVKKSRQEWERAVTFEAYEKNRNKDLPQLALFKDSAEQIAREAQDEIAVRKFLNERGVMTVPDTVKHYHNLAMPKYLAPIAWLGVSDDLTSPTRLDQDAVSYIREPSPDLGYFGASIARDPRPIILHEGVPGHYFQKVMSWRNPDPIRRHYYDSGANEGIGFYSEEMMLQAGLFDESPRSREVIYNFMRFRALRVEVDVKLATGEFDIPQAVAYFQKIVPLDKETATEDSVFYASIPGVGISYQTGKLQIMKLLAETRVEKGDVFSVREFHDFMWRNGNVPISLQRYELLGYRDELAKMDGQAQRLVPKQKKKPERKQ